MDTHNLASRLRQNRRPAQPHLGFSITSAIKDAGTAALDSAQSAGGEFIEEKVTEATGSEAIGQAASAGFHAGVDSAQGQNQQQPFTFIPIVPPSSFEGIYRAINIKNAKAANINLTPDQLALIGRRVIPISTLKPTGSSQEQLILDGQVQPAADTEAASSNSKTGWIIGGSILAIALIGGGVFLATRKK